jgi:hypothetical protein
MNPHSTDDRLAKNYRRDEAHGQKRYFPSKRSNPQDASCRYKGQPSRQGRRASLRRATWPGGSRIADQRQGSHITHEGFVAMRPNHLRVYYGPQEETNTLSIAETQDHRKMVSVPLMEVLPLLADAVQSERTWLSDFADDEVTISMDLYEVLLAYQHYRRPSA